jgi:ribonuclease HI
MTEWLANWKRRNWQTAAKKPVLNADLWRRLDSVAASHELEWHWVKGHSGHRENEIADQLANLGIDELRAAV